MTMTDPGNPNTGSFAIARTNDGSVFDPDEGMLGAAVYYERLDVADPDPGMAARIATERLRTLGGGVFTLTLRVVPQPWLEPGVVVGVEYNGTRTVAQVAGWTMDAAGDMTVTMRAWRVTSEISPPEYPVHGPHDLTINRAIPVGVDPAVDEAPAPQRTYVQSPPDVP